MMSKEDIDALKLEEELDKLGKCHRYVPTLSCVNGNNMKTFKNITLRDCQKECSNTRGCKGIEFYRESDSDKAVDTY